MTVCKSIQHNGCTLWLPQQRIGPGNIADPQDSDLQVHLRSQA